MWKWVSRTEDYLTETCSYSKESAGNWLPIKENNLVAIPAGDMELLWKAVQWPCQDNRCDREEKGCTQSWRFYPRIVTDPRRQERPDPEEQLTRTAAGS